MGAAVGHHLVPRHRHRPRAVGRPGGRGRRRPGVRSRPARLLRRGPGDAPGRHPHQGAEPDEHLVAGRGGRPRRRGGRRVRRGRLEPRHPRRRRGDPPRGRAHRRQRAALPRTARGAGRARAPGVGARAGHRGARPADAAAVHRLAPPLADPAHAGAGHGRHRPGRRRGVRARRARRAGPGARRTRPRRRARRQRRRPRAHRLGVAVAAAGDGPQGRPHGLERHLPDGRASRAGLRDVLGPAVGLDEGAPPRGVGPHAREGRHRPAGAGRRHVGRVRHQHARGRGVGPPAGARQTVLPRRARDRHPGGLAARLLRLHGGPAAARGAVGVHLVPDPEDLVEPDQPAPPSHLLVGGTGRHPRLHALPSRGHLQLRAQRRGDGAPGPQLLREGAGEPVPGPVRSRRRRRRTHPGDARPGRASPGPGGVGAGRDRGTVGVLREGSGGPRRPGRVGRGAVPGAAPRHLHDAGRHQAGQPAQRAPAARGRAVGHHRRGEVGYAVPGTRARPPVEDGPAPPVPRHPSRLLDRVGASRGTGDLRTGRPRAR